MTIQRYRTNQTLVDTGFNQQSGGTLTLCGNNIITNTATLQYTVDRSTYFNITPRAVPDVGYVSGLTSAISTIGTTGQIIYRGINGISGATGFIFNPLSGVTVPSLFITQTPPTDVCLDFILSWDSTSCKVHKIPYATAAGLSCGINGLTSLGGNVCLGGTLIVNTLISGVDIHSLDFTNLCGLCLSTTSNNIVIDSRCNSGGIYLKSQCGAINSPVSNYTCAIGVAIDYPSDIFKVYDNRAGISQRGIEYAADYAGNFTARSLVDKNYVDTIASGLQPHPAVKAATTGNTQLSGITSTTIIDGVTIFVGDRVLIKNQTLAKNNGIYVLTGGTGTTFVRASDFDQSSESVQGAYTFVLSGATNGSTSWVLSTPNPILLGTTPLLFTLFSQVTDVLGGHGICVTMNFGQHTVSVKGSELVGNGISWDGSLFNLGGLLTQNTIFTGSTICHLNYAGDYSAGFTAHSLIDKAYAQKLISGATSANTYNLQTPAAITVGGITAGTQLTGKTAFQLFEELLVPELFGTVIAPSTSINLSTTGTYEVGCVLSETVCGTFSRGSISPQYCSLSPFRSGCANAYCFTGAGMPAGWQSCALTPGCATNASYTVVSGSQTWGVCTRYNCGEDAKGSKGTVYCTKLLSGNTAGVSASITGLYPYYYGKLTSGSRPAVTNALVTTGCLAKCVLDSTGTVCVVFNSSAGEYTWLAIPATSTSKTCWFVNALDNGRINNSPSDKYPDECVIAITSAQGCWTGINYKVYMSGFAGAISSPICFRNS